SFSIDGPVHAGNQLKAMKDAGSLEKANWRFHMLDFARKVFPKGPGGSAMVLFPGASDAEYTLWHSFGFSYDSMVMVEGDVHKERQLSKKFGTEKRKPDFVRAYFGGNENNFVSALQSSLAGRKVSVLSFDTESAFSLQLYDD